MSKHHAIYLRVSTKRQDTASQEQTLFQSMPPVFSHVMARIPKGAAHALATIVS